MLPLLPQDKANHVVYGAVIAALSLVGGTIFRAPMLPFALIALAAVVAVAILKELVDRRSTNHTPDAMDAVATIAGGLVVVAPAFVSMI